MSGWRPLTAAPTSAAYARAVAKFGAKPRGPNPRGQEHATVRCPVHRGRSNNSLVITDGGDKVLVHCHGGCEPDEVLRAVGLSFRDLYDDPIPSGQASTSPIRRTPAQQQSLRTQQSLRIGASGSTSEALLGWGEARDRATAARLHALGLVAEAPGVTITGGRCWFRWDDERPRVDLPAVLAFRAYGGARDLSDVEECRWRELLDYRAGLLDRTPLEIPLPERTPEAARVVALALGHLIGLREPGVWKLADPFAFVGWADRGAGLIGFGAAYAGAVVGQRVPPDTVYAGLRWLTKHGLVGAAGATGKAKLRQLLPAALAGEQGPVLAAGVEAERPDANRVRGVGDRDLRSGHEDVRAVEPAAKLVDDVQVTDTELLPAVGPSLRQLRTAVGGAPRTALRGDGVGHGGDDTPSGYARPPSTLLQLLGSEDAVVSAFVDAFEATEVGAGGS